VATYYFFVLDDQGHMKTREQGDCLNEADAIHTARVHSPDNDVEVWCGTLKIATVRKDGTVERAAH
jgi:hypothetical protein